MTSFEWMLTRCARPRIGRHGTYTVMGLIGYVVATIAGATLAMHWQLSLTERVIAVLVPPSTFIIVVTIATSLAGRELIVFYQTTLAGVGAVVVASMIVNADTWRVLDVTVIGYGIFLVFGRLGCFGVACCHGRLARAGVRYGPAHVAIGLWPRMQYRALVPVQLIECGASLLLVVVGLYASANAGTAALVYAVGYSVGRFMLEWLRGDPVRPFVLGLSEAQWSALVTLVACVAARPSAWTLAPAVAVLGASVALVATLRRRELTLLPHLRALDEVCVATLADRSPKRRETALGVSVSVHSLPGERRDWVLSSTHPWWNARTARRIADVLWTEAEVIPGRSPGVVHVITSNDR